MVCTQVVYDDALHIDSSRCSLNSLLCVAGMNLTADHVASPNESLELYQHFGGDGFARKRLLDTDSDADDDSGIHALGPSSRVASRRSSISSPFVTPKKGAGHGMDNSHDSADESGYQTFLAVENDDFEDEIEEVQLQRDYVQDDDDVWSDEKVFKEGIPSVCTMRNLHSRLEEHLCQFQKQASCAERREHQLRGKRSKIMQNIKCRRDDLHKLVDRWYDKTVVAFQSQTGDELSSLTRMRENAERQIVMLSGACEAAKSLLAGDMTECGVPERMRAITPRLIKLDQQPTTVPEHQVCFQLSTGMVWEPAMFGTLSITRISEMAELPRALPQISTVCKPDMMFCFNSRETSQEHLTGDYMANGLSLTKNGNLVVSDIGTDSVKVFSATGRLVEEMCVLPDDHPTQAVELVHGRVAVTCKNNVNLYRQKGGDFVRGLHADLYSPQAVTSLQHHKSGPCLAVADITNNNVPVINIYNMESLKLLSSFSTDSGQTSCMSRSNPWYLCENTNGDIICTDLNDHTVKAFSQDGILKWVQGGKGCGPGQFFMPAGLCLDHYGHILVADCSNDRVHMLSPEGESLGIVVDEKDGLENPVDVVVNAEGELVLLQGDGHVKRFRYVH